MRYIRKLRAVKALRRAGWASLALFPVFCWFILEYYNTNTLWDLLTFWRQYRIHAYFGLLVCFLLFGLVLLLLGRAAPACALTGGASVLIAFINSMKLALNGDHFFPKDVLMAGEAGSLLSFLSGGPPKYMPLAVLLLVLWCAGLAALGLRLPVRRRTRLFCAASALSLSALFCSGQSRMTALLERFEIINEYTMLQSMNYAENGFIGAFVLNLNNMGLQQPHGYSKGWLDGLLSGYERTPANREPFDVILVLSESFCDLREMPGLTFSANPLPRYDELLQRDNCYSGSLYSNAIGGGTVRPEFEILTGLSTEALPVGATPYEFVDGPLEGYVSNYRDAGYRTAAMHPHTASFYARNTAYPNLGFDDFYSFDELSAIRPLEYSSRGFPTDAALAWHMERLLDEAEEPVFLFAITMENHQPFDPMPEQDVTLTVSSDRLSPESLGIVTAYVQGLRDADRMLGELADYIDRRERPTVLIFFGDHKPTLGANYQAYQESGFFPASHNERFDLRSKMYTTPFLIYANRELDPGLFSQNTGNALSTYYLLDAAALCTGFQRTPYMNLLLDCFEKVPVYNERLAMEQTPDIQEVTRIIHSATYERLSKK